MKKSHLAAAMAVVAAASALVPRGGLREETRAYLRHVRDAERTSRASMLIPRAEAKRLRRRERNRRSSV